jgi:hypothetical protein
MYKVQQKFVIYSITVDGDKLEGPLCKTTKRGSEVQLYSHISSSRIICYVILNAMLILTYCLGC